MKFRATFTRGDQVLPVSGEVLPTERGRRGKFIFSVADAPKISPGPAQLITEDGEAWQVMVLNTTVTTGANHGEGEFRFRGDTSTAKIVR